MATKTQLGVVQSKLPDNRHANILVAHEFISSGIDFLVHSEEKSASTDLESIIFILGKSSVGMTCLAQGFELLLDTIVQAEGIDVPKIGGQHALVPKFQAICERAPELKNNTEEVLGAVDHKTSRSSAEAFLKTLEDNFLPARYFGVTKSRNKLETARSLTAGKMAVSIASTFPMLRPIELAQKIGFKVSK